ncbi:MAG: methenyltetrahydrofolate cyclohydrolase [Betaproteobacteria bacterium]|nr:methenyltetrahydrofolate cyclohydrolase [Betaproteobacteria bacterium]
MTMQQLPVEQFLDQLASSQPTPGGGSAAAVMGAMGAALVSMVANLTVGKKKYAEVEPQVKEVLAESEKLRAQLTAALQEDVAAFDTVMAAYGLPKDSDEQKAARSAAIQSALKEATEAPLHCARLAHQVLPLTLRIAEIGNVNIISDAGVAVLAAQAALRSAVLNVFVNAAAIEDKAFAQPRMDEAERLMAEGAAMDAKVFGLVKQTILGN